MSATDVTFRHVLRGLPRPILRPASPHGALEPMAQLAPSVDRQRTTDHQFRVRDGGAGATAHVEIDLTWRAGKAV